MRTTNHRQRAQQYYLQHVISHIYICVRVFFPRCVLCLSVAYTAPNCLPSHCANVSAHVNSAREYYDIVKCSSYNKHRVIIHTYITNICAHRLWLAHNWTIRAVSLFTKCNRQSCLRMRARVSIWARLLRSAHTNNHYSEDPPPPPPTTEKPCT